MIEMLPVAIGFGLVISLLLSELLGVASAGMVVPGYLALYLTQPAQLLTTLAATLITYGAVRLLGSMVILYGRRRTAVAILLGYLFGAIGGWLGTLYLPGIELGDSAVIGYIIPGLIAIWMDRQGVLETLGALTVCSVTVRLLLLLVLGQEVLP